MSGRREPVPDASIAPATAPTTPAQAQATWYTRLGAMPWASAASWSRALARMARPSVENLNIRKKATSTTPVMPIVHTSAWAMSTSPHCQVFRPHGSARSW